HRTSWRTVFPLADPSPEERRMNALFFANVTASYGARPILSSVTASFRSGAVTAIVGPNGAGKTTLFRTALGVLPSDGVIRVLDNDLRNWSREGLAKSIAYLPQGTDAHWPIPAKRLVALGRLPHRRPFAPSSNVDDIAVADALDRCEASEF